MQLQPLHRHRKRYDPHEPEHRQKYALTDRKISAEAVPYISVAVDPDVIPLGSTVWLVFSDGGQIECRADDTGVAITGARIDLCVSSHTEALEHGIDYITVYWEVEEDVSH
jgi:3D (Asp-Asp-Asp) domain-containing protein